MEERYALAADTTSVCIPEFESCGDYSSNNYGVNSLRFTDKDGITYYFSYKTLVAVSIPGKGQFVHENDWGTTTGKHLNWIDGGNKASRLSDNEFNVKLKEHGIITE